MTPFEHTLVWKYCVVFGTFFNDIVIQRGDQNTNNQNNLAQVITNTIPKQDIPKQYQNALYRDWHLS